ncbi:VanW family protein [Clostridium sp. DL1XJH146]
MDTNNTVETKEVPKESKKSKKSKNKKIGISIAALLAVAIIGTGSYFYSVAQKWNDLIMPNVYVEDINLTGMTKDEASSKLKTEFSDAILQKKVEITVGEEKFQIGYDELNATYNIEETISEAFEYGKDMSIIDKLKTIYKPVDEKLDLDFSYNEKPIDSVISQIEKEINKEPKAASIKYLGNSKFEVTDDVKGAIVDSKELISLINEKIKEEEGDITVEAPIEELIAEPTGKQLRSIDTIVGSHNTSYTTSSYARSTNIEVATKAINGLLLMPGETFSFNEVVGKRTAAAGYMEAPVIVNKELVPGLGGGICQVSTTLYNAALKGGYEIVDRSHHTYPSHYADIGRDATVDYGNLDFAFKNNFDYPIYIQGYSKSKNLYFNIFSAKELTNRRYVITNDVYATFEPTTKIIEDPNMLVGEEEFDTQPHTGYKAKVYRTVYEGDTKIETQTISSDYYVPINGVKRVGTKEPEPVVEDTTQATPTTDEEPTTTEPAAEQTPATTEN